MLVLPKSSTFVAIASLCAMALPALAQDMIFVKAENGVTFDVDGDSRTGQTSYEFIGSLNGAFTVNLPDGSRPHCTMSGTYNQATFTLTPALGTSTLAVPTTASPSLALAPSLLARRLFILT